MIVHAVKCLMNMTAQHGPHMLVPPDDLPEPLAVIQPDLIQPATGHGNRMMVQRYQRVSGPGVSKQTLQLRQFIITKQSGHPARCMGIERDHLPVPQLQTIAVTRMRSQCRDQIMIQSCHIGMIARCQHEWRLPALQHVGYAQISRVGFILGHITAKDNSVR